MSKLTKIFQGLKAAHDGLVALDEAGIDVDRLVGISNAQGGVARSVQSILEHISKMDRNATTFDSLPHKSGKDQKRSRASKPQPKQLTGPKSIK